MANGVVSNAGVLIECCLVHAQLQLRLPDARSTGADTAEGHGPRLLPLPGRVEACPRRGTVRLRRHRAGFCALAFAERTLSHDPHARILILERGPFFLPQHFQNLPLPYRRTLGGLSETFPWTLSARTANQPAGNIGWQHGMVPFFGGRSIMWSAWCPRPEEDEMRGWPAETIAAAQRNFAAAESLLNVMPADRIDSAEPPAALEIISRTRPVYGPLQKGLQKILADEFRRIDSGTRWHPAPLAAAAGADSGMDFAKFSTPAVLLDLADRQALAAARASGAPLSIVTECAVERIHSQAGAATALETSRGVLALGDARLVLAMGTLPPATLVFNSFPDTQGCGNDVLRALHHRGGGPRPAGGLPVRRRAREPRSWPPSTSRG